MERSELKEKLSVLIKVDKKLINFALSEDYIAIKVNKSQVRMCLSENAYCCGILECGDTEYTLINEINSKEKRDELAVDCFNQIYDMIKENNGDINDDDDDNDNLFHKGILTWSHTNDNPIVIGLKSEFNTPDMPWKLVSEFYNPNSGNTVCYFIARLVD